jgi:hypothetical protein
MPDEHHIRTADYISYRLLLIGSSSNQIEHLDEASARQSALYRDPTRHAHPSNRHRANPDLDWGPEAVGVVSMLQVKGSSEMYGSDLEAATIIAVHEEKPLNIAFPEQRRHFVTATIFSREFFVTITCNSSPFLNA